MAFDDPAPQTDSARRLSIVARQGGWAIMHGNGFLGVAADRDEAVRLLKSLEDQTVHPVSRRPR